MTIPQHPDEGHIFTRSQDPVTNPTVFGQSVFLLFFNAITRSIEGPDWRPWCRWMGTIVTIVILMIVLKVCGVWEWQADCRS